ncbi:MAG: potassium-transporting ATPase subunit KdpC [Bacteroidales bacterium]|jgi:K+-transporting ATPase ATPase C chain|nr:potassium-transporting ATPase subunit KdpC [Bacteroidales bacterium]
MKTILVTLKAFLLLTLVTGVIYPVLITGIVQLIFPEKAGGSLIIRDSIVIGSKLTGQEFSSPGYFSPRPSSNSYNPLPSGGSNFGPTNTKQLNQVDERRKQFIYRNHPDTLKDVPSEMLFASASGLDPHISRESAMMQVDRVSQERGFDDAQRQKLIQCIDNLTEAPQFLILGEERLNVLLLNLETDKIK